MPKMRDLTNQRFGKLIAIRPTEQRKSNSVVWLCACDCGSERLACAHNLLRGDTKSCGCSTSEMTSHITHGKHAGPGYWSWANMKQRCENPKATGYKNYGAIGVKVCERWKSFANFTADMGDPPPGHSIDRINPFGNYEPGNCRWATRDVQRKNIRANHVAPASSSSIVVK